MMEACSVLSHEPGLHVADLLHCISEENPWPKAVLCPKYVKGHLWVHELSFKGFPGFWGVLKVSQE